MGFIFLSLYLSFLFFTSHALSDFDPTQVTQLSWKPRAFLYKGFLSNEECDHIISLARGKLQKSTVADYVVGKNVLTKDRTSSGMFLKNHQDDIVTRIERRIASWTFLPEENGEGIQILRYEIGEKYVPHHDFFNNKINIARGGNPYVSIECGEGWGDYLPLCRVKPEKGDALLFFSLHTDATPDPLSVHASCPVIAGEKWSATKWIHVRTFDRSAKLRVPNVECVDKDELCPQWAKQGECEKNPYYMVGFKGVPGVCRRSCNACNY